MGLLVYGLINSMSLALMAIGFALVYGVSRIANFAHGAIYVLAGFLTWTFLISLELNYGVAIAISLIVVALIGAALYQFILVRVRGMPSSEIMVSFAIGLAIMEGLRWAGFIGPTYILPPFYEGSTEIAGVPVDFQRLIILGEGLVVVVVLWLFTHYTKVGLALRAIAQNERAAMMLGIDSDLTAVISLAIGSALAGVAAITILPLGNITAAVGYDVLIYALAVCILGGLGSWVGTLISAFLLGFAQILTTAYVAAEYSMVVVLLIIIVILILKPSGLFGRQKEFEERV